MGTEAENVALQHILDDVFDQTQSEEGRKAALRMRRERRIAFLKEADQALSANNKEPIRTEKGFARETDPVEVNYHGINIPVRIAEKTYMDKHEIIKTTAIVGVLPNGKDRYFFSVETHMYGYGNSPYSVIRNQRQSIASNEEVLRGLNALRFIASELERKSGRGSAPTA